MNDEQHFTVYLTKFALTQGIIPVLVKRAAHTSLVEVVGAKWTTYYHEGDWQATEAEAISKAEAMRAKKVASVKKQIAKLQALRFTPSPEDRAEDRT